MINVALVGLGRIADLHSPGYVKNRNARIYAVCDSNGEVASTRKKQWKAEKVYTDYQELLSDPKVDAVEILTPQHFHEAMVIEAARSKKHIAVQKPMTIDLKSADRMNEAAMKAGTVYKVTENYIFYPPIVQARKLIEEGEIGTVISVRIRLISAGMGGWPIPASAWEWRMKESSKGRGMNTFDHGHHLWSTAWYLGGEIEKTKAWIDSIDGVVDSPATVMWKYRGPKKYGVCDLVHCPGLEIPSDYYANDEWMEVVGTNGFLKIHRCTGKIHSGPVLSVFNGKKMKHYNIPSDWKLGFVGATNNFINSILGKEKPMLSGSQGKEILKFALAIRKSSDVGREVYLDEMGKVFPSLYAWKIRNKERFRIFFEKLSIPGFSNTDKFAPQAEELTKSLANRFDPSAAANWKVDISLKLLAEGGVEESVYNIKIENCKCSIQKGHFDEGADLRLTIGSGTWSAILLEKKRIEIAFMQGKLKADGRLEEGLRLRSVFGI